jgi:hypothetical protein
MLRRIVCAAALMAAPITCVHAQWVNYPTPGIPRTADGKPNLSAPAPRTFDGKPDLSGIWQVEPTPWTEMKPLVGNLNDLFAPGDDLMDFSKYAINILADFKRGEEPLRPEADAAMRRPRVGSCLPQGIPFIYLIPAPAKWIQSPGLTVILFEGMNGVRQIYTDGRKPPADPQPMWQGYSTGRWEGDTLVIDAVGFNDKTRLDATGHPHSEALHLTERYHRRDFGHLDVETTIDDPKLYTKPLTIHYTELLQPDTDILEYVCQENERDQTHMPKQ